MADRHMRNLERAAVDGDREARLRLTQARLRNGLFNRFKRIKISLMDGDHLWEIRNWGHLGGDPRGIDRPDRPVCGVIFRRVLNNGKLGSINCDSSAARNYWAAGGIDVLRFLANYCEPA